MSNNQNIETIHPDNFPPHFDTYYQDEENKRGFVSYLCQPSERDDNIRMARFIADKTQDNIFVLPHIQPTKKGAERLRKEFFPEGVKENKNPDYYFRGRFVDGKNMMDIKESDIKTLKRKIQNRLGEAFVQADDAFWEIPPLISTNLLEDAIRGRLNSSNHKHLVYIKQGETFLIFP